MFFSVLTRKGKSRFRLRGGGLSGSPLRARAQTLPRSSEEPKWPAGSAGTGRAGPGAQAASLHRAAANGWQRCTGEGPHHPQAWAVGRWEPSEAKELGTLRRKGAACDL